MKSLPFIGALVIAGLLAIAPAVAQNEFPSGTQGKTVVGMVPMVLDNTGIARPNSATEPMYVTGSFSASISPFQPAQSYATLTVAGSSVNVALPTNTGAVVVSNTGTTAISCVLSVGAGIATASEDIIQPASSVEFAVGSNTYENCIDQTGSTSNVVTISGGAGLFAGAGGGSSGGAGGGAVTLAAGSVSAGAFVSGSVLSGAFATGAITDLALAQGSTTSGEVGNLVLTATTTTAPTYTTTKSNPISTDTAGNTRVVLNPETTKVIGEVNQGTSPWVVGQGTAANLNATVVGTGTFAVQAGPSVIATWGLMSGTVPGTAPSNTQIVGEIYNSAAPTPSNGQTLPFQSDSSGRLIVNCGSGCGGSGGTSIADEAAFTQGTTAVTPLGGLYATSITNLTAGQAGVARLTNDRKLMVDQPNSEVAQGGAAAATDAVQTAGVYNSTPLTLTNGQASALQLDSSGRMIVNVGTATGLAQGATYSSQTFSGVMGLASTNAPTATAGDLWALSISPASGGVRIDLKDTAANTNPFLVNPGTIATWGLAANGGTLATNGQEIGGQAVNAEPAATTNGKQVTASFDLVGKQITSPFANKENYVKGTTSAMTGTTSTQVVALVASQKLYITAIHCTNSSASVPTLVSIQDGSGGTVLDTLAANDNFGGEDRTGSTPLFWTTAGNGLYAADVTTGASVICQASGYSGV